jgi:hypothetical protein
MVLPVDFAGAGFEGLAAAFGFGALVLATFFGAGFLTTGFFGAVLFFVADFFFFFADGLAAVLFPAFDRACVVDFLAFAFAFALGFAIVA